jgi:methylated-DNA-protein-cysteine methyltransferase-like protein
MPQDYAEAIIKVVRQIPHGHVATYGQIAKSADLPGYARHVGHVLANLPVDTDVPWHRVINAKGQISSRRYSLGCEDFQRQLLEAEGVTFSEDDRISLREFQWVGT